MPSFQPLFPLQLIRVAASQICLFSLCKPPFPEASLKLEGIVISVFALLPCLLQLCASLLPLLALLSTPFAVVESCQGEQIRFSPPYLFLASMLSSPVNLQSVECLVLILTWLNCPSWSLQWDLSRCSCYLFNVIF